ncbi:hypothetical protein ACIREE_42580 [Streptomyces sp. NPDC102467]|uniref:hypothetical protein n=1 Tax=Streptomyces sp. NPDC102467 TaxID=3366179 RepID=UPI00380F2CF5
MITASRGSSTSSSTQQPTSAGRRAKRLKIFQQQVGHECDSSLAIYTHVSDDFMNTSLHTALAPAFTGA